jgi:nitrogen fixation protein FixH
VIKVPPQYFWPGLVITLLSLTVVFNVVIYNVANSGNGAQPVDDYYGKAVDYDEAKARERAADNLGLDFQVGFVDAGAQGRQVEVIVRDGQSQPIERLEASVELRRPSLSKPVVVGELVPVSGETGVYRLASAVQRPGLWDVVVDGTYSDTAFRKTVRIEWTD